MFIEIVLIPKLETTPDSWLDEWVNNLGYIYVLEYFSAIKKQWAAGAWHSLGKISRKRCWMEQATTLQGSHTTWFYLYDIFQKDKPTVTENSVSYCLGDLGYLVWP